MDLSCGIKITPVYVDLSARPAVDTHWGAGDQNCHSAAAEITTTDSNEPQTDTDLSIVDTPVQQQENEPS